MKTDPRIKTTNLVIILVLTAAIVSPLGLGNLHQMKAQTVPHVTDKIYTSIPEDFTPTSPQAWLQVGGYEYFHQTQQQKINNGLKMEVSTKTPAPTNLSPAKAQPTTSPSPTPTSTATSVPNETQGTITFIAVSAATLVLAVIAFAWILKQTKKPPKKLAPQTTQVQTGRVQR